jgi:hypothetical protein
VIRRPASVPLLTSVLAVVAALPADAHAQAFACGATIRANATLTADVVCPAGRTGLFIGASNITVDFNGHKVVITGGAGGVEVNARSNVTLRNVVVQNTQNRAGYGIYASNTVNLAIDDATLDDLFTGVLARGANPGLSVTDSSVQGSASWGMELRGLSASSVIDRNTFDGSGSGVLLANSALGPITLGPTNTFANVTTSPSASVVSLSNLSGGVVVDGLNLATAGVGIGIRIDSVQNAVVTDNVLSGLARGVYATGASTNTNLTLQGNNVANASEYGMYLDSVDATLALDGNAFTNCGVYGLRLQDLVGPFALDGTNSFSGAGAGSSTGRALWLDHTTDVTVGGVTLSGIEGTGVFLDTTTGTVIDASTIDGRRVAVATTSAANPGLVISDNSVRNALESSLSLTGVTSSLVVSGNDFSGSREGLVLTDLAGPWTLGAGNIFTGVANAAGRAAIALTGGSALTIDGADVSGTGLGIGVRASGINGLTVQNTDASSRQTGISVTGSNQNVAVRDVDVSSAGSFGVSLVGVNDLELANLDLTLANNGVYLESITNTPLLDLTGTSFTGLAPGAGFAVRARSVSGMELTGIDAAMPISGTSVRVETSANVTVSDVSSCGAGTAASFTTVTGSTVQNASFGAPSAGTTYGLVVSGGGGNTFRDSATLVDFARRDLGASPATQVINVTQLADADSDGNPDVCDICPLDPLDNQPCVNPPTCSGGDGITDVDGDLYCAGVTPGSDCDDGDAAVNPGATEACDGIDNDCDASTDEGAPFADTDADTCNDCALGAQDPNNDGTDTDADGVCDAGDPDDDDDTVADGSDVDPLDPFLCEDGDLDDCDDCSVAGLPQPGNDGTDTDTDGFCNASDFTLSPTVLVTKPAWNTRAGAGAGAPTVVWDTDHFVMVYETQTGPGGASGCPNGVWNLGLATSTDGVTWTDAGGPLVTLGGYYSCVAAHPTMVKNGAGPIVLFFKAEDSTGLRGIGRMVLSWNGSAYVVSSVDPTPALAMTSFGYPKAVYDNVAGQYRVAYTDTGMYVTSGSGSSLAAGTLVLSPGFESWAPDALINPAVTCEDDGSYLGYLGGRDTDLSGAVLDASMGRRSSPAGDFSTWSAGPGPLVQLSAGDPEMRHWDVLRAGTSDHLLFFSERANGTGPVQIRMGWTGTAMPDPATTQDKVCQ